jgi:hypothetical protein
MRIALVGLFAMSSVSMAGAVTVFSDTLETGPLGSA